MVLVEPVVWSHLGQARLYIVNKIFSLQTLPLSTGPLGGILELPGLKAITLITSLSSKDLNFSFIAFFCVLNLTAG